MGIRNITRVISDGKVKVCQYGQWDGYPTYTGEKVLEFVRDTDLKEFKEKLDSCEFKVTNSDHTSYTGAPYMDKVFELFEDIMYNSNAPIETRKKTFKNEVIKKYGVKAYAAYLIATRDTGVDVLNVIMEYAPLKLYADDYLMMEETDWQIEAINVIDLDRKEVRMMWHDEKKTVKFKDIPNMDIEKEMKEFEEC